MTGRIIRISANESYGFIRGEDSLDYFFHKGAFIGFWEDLMNDFNREKMPVDVVFEPNEGPKGKRAENVKRLDWPN